MKLERKRLLSMVLAVCMLTIFLGGAFPVIPSSAAEYDPQTIVDFNNAEANGSLNFKGSNPGATWTTSSKTVSPVWSIAEGRSGAAGDKSLKYTGNDDQTANNDWDSGLTITTAIPSNACGFTVWYKSEGTASIALKPIVLNSSGRVAVFTPASFEVHTGGIWQKVTYLLDNFTKNGTDDAYAGITNAAISRDQWNSVTGIRFRTGDGWPAQAGRKFQLDDFEWIFQKSVEDFESKAVGTGADDIKVAYNGYDGAGSVLPAEPASIVTGTSTGANPNWNSDSGKSLKIPLGETTAAYNTSGDQSGANPWIKITIPLDDKYLIGSGLRVWMRNDSGAQILTRYSLVSDFALTGYNSTFRFDIANTAIRARDNTDANIHSAIQSLPYTKFHTYTSGADGILEYGGDSINPLRMITEDQTKSIKEINIYIMPRVTNTGGTVYIDGIALRDPEEEPEEPIAKTFVDFNNSEPNGAVNFLEKDVEGNTIWSTSTKTGFNFWSMVQGRSENPDDKSLKLTGTEITTGTDYDTRLNVNTTIPSNACGFTIWYKSAGTAAFAIRPNMFSGSSLIASLLPANFDANTNGVWKQVTYLFDNFTKPSSDESNGVVSNAVISRDQWNSITQIRFRLGNYGFKPEGAIFQLDDFEWIFEKPVEDFESKIVGTGTNDIKVAYSGYDGAAGSTAPVETPSIVMGDTTNWLSDSKKSLKIPLGTIGSGVTATAGTLEGTDPWIKVTIPIDDTYLVGSGLRVWFRNASGANIITRYSIVSEHSLSTYGNTFRYDRESTGVTLVNDAGHIHSNIKSLPYSNFYSYNSGTDGILGWGGSSIPPERVITAEQTKSIKQLNIYIMPRYVNTGGTVYIDGITLRDPQPPEILEEEYSITYNLEGGDWNSGFTPPEIFTLSDSVSLPNYENISRSGYIFGGWYNNENFTGNAVFSLPTNSTGDRQYWAKWVVDIIHYSYDNITAANINGTDGDLFDGWRSMAAENITMALNTDPVNMENDDGGQSMKVNWQIPTGSTSVRYRYGTSKLIFGGTNDERVGDGMRIWIKAEQAVEFRLGIVDIVNYNDYHAPSIKLEAGASAIICVPWTSFGNYYATGMNCRRPGITFVGTEGASGAVYVDNLGVYYDDFYQNRDLEFELNGGSWAAGYSAKTVFTADESVILPKQANVIKNGFIFAGWYENEELTGGCVLLIPRGTMKDKKYWAKWIFADQINYPFDELAETRISNSREQTVTDVWWDRSALTSKQSTLALNTNPAYTENSSAKSLRVDWGASETPVIWHHHGNANLFSGKSRPLGEGIRFWVYSNEQTEVAVTIHGPDYSTDGPYYSPRYLLPAGEAVVIYVSWDDIKRGTARLLDNDQTSVVYPGFRIYGTGGGTIYFDSLGVYYADEASMVTNFNYTSPDGKVVVTAYDNLLASDTVVKVTEYTSSTLTEWGVQLPEGGQLGYFANIALYDTANTTIEPGGNVWISFKIPSGANPMLLGLYSVFFDGSLVPVSYVLEGNMMTFSAYNMGSFLMVTNDTKWSPGGPALPGAVAKPPVVEEEKLPENKPIDKSNDDGTDNTAEIDDNDIENDDYDDNEAENTDEEDETGTGKSKRGALVTSEEAEETSEEPKKSGNPWLIPGIIAGIIILAGGGTAAFILLKVKRGKKPERGSDDE